MRTRRSETPRRPETEWEPKAKHDRRMERSSGNLEDDDDVHSSGVIVSEGARYLSGDWVSPSGTCPLRSRSVGTSHRRGPTVAGGNVALSQRAGTGGQAASRGGGVLAWWKQTPAECRVGECAGALAAVHQCSNIAESSWRWGVPHSGT